MKARRKSEDNPNTQITILFCSKSLSIIRATVSPTVSLVKPRFVKAAAYDYLPGLRRVRRSLLRRTRSFNLSLYLVASTSHEEALRALLPFIGL